MFSPRSFQPYCPTVSSGCSPIGNPEHPQPGRRALLPLPPTPHPRVFPLPLGENSVFTHQWRSQREAPQMGERTNTETSCSQGLPSSGLNSFASPWYVSIVYGLSRVRLFATPWTVAHQAPLSMAFPRQEYWSVHFLLQGGLPDPGIEPESLTFPALAGRFFSTSATWEALVSIKFSQLNFFFSILATSFEKATTS